MPRDIHSPLFLTGVNTRKRFGSRRDGVTKVAIAP